MKRSDQRREAVFALYQHDVTGKPLADIEGEAKPFTRALIDGVEAGRAELDEAIGAASQGWALDRIAPLELNIMRVAIYEARELEGVPTEVAIDEAVELAKAYCGADAPGYVNGVLASILVD